MRDTRAKDLNIVVFYFFKFYEYAQLICLFLNGIQLINKI